MIGNVRSLNLASAPAAALHKAALRVRRATHRLRAHAQVRLNLAAAAPRGNIVGASVIPTVRYRDVPKAVDWLCRAFGMRVHRLVTDDDGAPRYAELTVGAGMLMVAPIEDTAFGKLMVQPDEIGGVETQVCYLCVSDARAHSERAKAAGAVIIIDADDEVNKGRGYSCRDPEGHVWNFGTYDPWGKLPPATPAPRWVLRRVPHALAALVVLAVAATVVARLVPQPGARAGIAVAATPAEAPPAVAEERKETAKSAKAAALTLAPPTANPGAPADDGAPDADEASIQRAALEAAEKTASVARAQLAEARGSLAKAERDAIAARSQLEELQRAKLAAERATAETRAQLATAQKTAERARAQAALERARRVSAARAAARARRSGYSARARQAYWCYDTFEANPGARARGRLNGFCRG